MKSGQGQREEGRITEDPPPRRDPLVRHVLALVDNMSIWERRRLMSELQESA